MQVKFKKLISSASVPTKAHPSDAGFDLVATSLIFDEYGCATYGTGIAIEIPRGYVGLVFPRSSICKQDIFLTNSVGVIDSGYRGEIMAKFKPGLRFGKTPNFKPHGYNIGDRIAQLLIIPYPEIEFVQSEHLSSSDRGAGGYGSTGK